MVQLEEEEEELQLREEEQLEEEEEKEDCSRQDSLRDSCRDATMSIRRGDVCANSEFGCAINIGPASPRAAGALGAVPAPLRRDTSNSGAMARARAAGSGKALLKAAPCLGAQPQTEADRTTFCRTV